MHFRFYPLRFSFVARDSLYFPPGKPGNLLRGAFGEIFRRIACVPECTGARGCELAATCPYARMFEPTAIRSGPSGFADWPRPFVFRASHLDGSRIAPGGAFAFDLNLFDLKNPAIEHLRAAFSQLAEVGIGPGRGRAELTDVSPTEPMILSLDATAGPVERVRVRFVTPTELKGAERPEFAVLASRIRDRVSKLGELYGAGPLDMDFRGFGERAAGVKMTRCELQHLDVERRSSRTGQTHSLGGFVGEAEYEGDLAEFVPFLRVAKWTGVGRQTVWGKGEIETRWGIPALTERGYFAGP